MEGSDKKRYLMRWTDDTDRRLLLSIQYACVEKNVRLPWDAIAKVLDPQITDGAIQQHLAKLRKRLVSNGVLVPPPLRKGGVTNASVTSPRSEHPEKGSSLDHAAGNVKPSRRKSSLDHQEAGDSSESDEEYTPNSKKKKRGTRTSRRLRKKRARSSKYTGNSEPEDGSQAEDREESENEQMKLTTHHIDKLNARNEDNTAKGQEQSEIEGSVMDYWNSSEAESDGPDQDGSNQSAGLIVLRISKDYCSVRFPAGLATWPAGDAVETDVSQASDSVKVEVDENSENASGRLDEENENHNNAIDVPSQGWTFGEFTPQQLQGVGAQFNPYPAQTSVVPSHFDFLNEPLQPRPSDGAQDPNHFGGLVPFNSTPQTFDHNAGQTAWQPELSTMYEMFNHQYPNQYSNDAVANAPVSFNNVDSFIAPTTVASTESYGAPATSLGFKTDASFEQYSSGHFDMAGTSTATHLPDDGFGNMDFLGLPQVYESESFTGNPSQSS